jgi:hypothetical protein
MTKKDIDKLRKLIDSGIPKELSYPGHTRIITDSLAGIRRIIQVHSPKLVAPESPAEKSDPFLFKKDRTFGIEFYKCNNNRQ